MSSMTRAFRNRAQDAAVAWRGDPLRPSVGCFFSVSRWLGESGHQDFVKIGSSRKSWPHSAGWWMVAHRLNPNGAAMQSTLLALFVALPITLAVASPSAATNTTSETTVTQGRSDDGHRDTTPDRKGKKHKKDKEHKDGGA
jgi:hypothetical protein